MLRRPLAPPCLVLSLAMLGALAVTGFGTVVRAQSNDRIAQARALFEQGDQAYRAGDFHKAADKMLAAYRLTHSPDLAFNVGRVYERMGDADRGIHWFQVYLRSGHPSDQERADITQRIAGLREIKQRQRDQVFTAPPSHDALTAEARAFFLRGVTMFKRHHYEAAMQAFTAAEGFAPLPEILYNMAVTAERLHHVQDAIDYYNEYLRLRHDAPDRAIVLRKIQALRDSRR